MSYLKYLYRLRARVIRVPPSRPPTWARQSTPPMTKPRAKLIRTIPMIPRHSTPTRAPIKARDPKRPKTIPDAPTLAIKGSLKRALASDPKIRDMSKIRVYLVLPK